MNKNAYNFLEKNGMLPERIDPLFYSDKIAEDMGNGLAGKESDMPMIPTYLSNDGILPLNAPAAIIDAGGTNFRRALVTFEEDGCCVSDFDKFRMPGIENPATWEEFISFTADKVEPLMDRTDVIGFCFSYEAKITPEMDGCVVTIDKEVKVTGATGKLLGKSLSEELERRGYPGKRVVILNDTVAVLLGGTASMNKAEFSGFVGQVSGTGTNTCCIVPANKIYKIHSDSSTGMIVNMESGSFRGLPSGTFDRLLDEKTNCPGLKFLEKLTAGVYLGGLIKLMANRACEEKLLSEQTLRNINEVEYFDSSYVDAWSEGRGFDGITDWTEEQEILSAFSLALVQRSARCMSSVLLGIAKYTDTGKTADRPLCDCAEGSLVLKCRNYRTELEKLLKSFELSSGRYIILKTVHDSTVAGSAAAALLNA